MFFAGFVFGIILSGVIAAIAAAVHYNLEATRIHVLLGDWDSGEGRILKGRPKRDGSIVDKKMEGKPRYILEGAARLNAGKKGPWYVVHKRHGWNLVGPGRDEVENNRRLQYSTIHNPWTYAMAEEHNDAQDSLYANIPRENWKTAAVVGAVVVFALLLGVLGFVASKLGGGA